MKTLLLIVGLLISFGVALPAAAQDSACHIDLASTVALLVQAQASAASGDTETALAQIAQAQTKLDAFAERCATNSGDDPVPPTDVALTQTFTLEGFDGDMTFSYPEGWAQT